MSQNPFVGPVPSTTTQNPFVGEPTIDVNGVRISRQDIADSLAEDFGPILVGPILRAIANPLNPANAFGVAEAGGALTNLAVETGKDLAAFGKFAGREMGRGLGPMQVGVGLGHVMGADIEGKVVTEEEERALRGAALTGAVAVDIASQGVAIPARAALAQLVRGAAAGSLYGLMRPKSDAETLPEAIAKDALLFGGMNLGIHGLAAGYKALARKEMIESSVADIVTRSTRKLTDDILDYIVTRGSEPVRAEAIAQTRELPAVLGGTLEQLRSLEAQRASQGLAELRSLKQSMADGTSATVALERLRFQGTRTIGQTREGLITGIEEASKIGDHATAGRLARELEMLETYKATQGGAEAFGHTVQDALDNLANRTGSNVGGGIEHALRLLESERGAIRLGLEPPPLIPPELARNIRIVEHPRDLWLYGRFVAPPHTWARLNPIAGAIQRDAVQRRLVQDEVHAEWRDLIMRTKKELPKKDRIELGQLLDSYVRGEDLPDGTPQKLAQLFGEWRTRLSKDRESLRKLVGADADWGIDAYFMHTFVGDWQITNAATGGTVPGGFARTLNEAVEIAKQALAKNPDLDIQIAPKTFAWEQDAATELGGKAYHAFITRAQQVLNLEREDVIALTRGLTKPKGRYKGFGAMRARESNLPGFLDDPTEAAAVYAHGLARKLAFHDWEVKATALLDKANLKALGQGNLHDALADYIARVNGKAGPIERGWNSMINWAFSSTPLRSSPVAAQNLRARQVSATIRKIESIWRLGYSPLSSFVNLSQTLVNTSTEIGYRDTAEAALQLLRSVKLGGDKQLAKRIDGLLVEMGIEYAVPLSEAGTVFGATHKVAPWHPLYLFNKAENVNRGIAGLAGYNRAIRAGLDHNAAVKAGKALSDKVNFVYSVEDLPQLLAGPTGQVLGQFKPFLVNELSFIAGLRGAQIPRFVANITAAGGVGLWREGERICEEEAATSWSWSAGTLRL
jgi:hypothetical protein